MANSLVTTTNIASGGEDRKLAGRSNRCCLLFRFFVDSSIREMLKRKFNFCLGAMSVMIVVLVAAVCFTVIAKTPVVFLQQAESTTGHYDVLLRGKTSRYLNYTQVALNANTRIDYSYNSPRFKFSGSARDKQCFDYIDEQYGFDPFEPLWKYEGFSNNDNDGCDNRTLDCIALFCGTKYVDSTIVLVDSIKEERMQFGRDWSFNALSPGEVIVGQEFAKDRSLSKGDIFYMRINLYYESVLYHIIERGLIDTGDNTVIGTNATLLLNDIIDYYGKYVNVPFTIAGIYKNPGGKFANNKKANIVAEYKDFIPYITTQMHSIFHEHDILTLLQASSSASSSYNIDNGITSLPHSLAELILLSNDTLYSYASEVYLNLPPERVNPYITTTNYDIVQNEIIEFVSSAMYYIGYPEISPELSVLSGLEGTRFFSLFLGLILSIILTILFVLSTMLLYSLLLISVETRTFEMGVHRMVGMSTTDIVQLIMMQAMSYAIPAWAGGLIISQLIVTSVLTSLESQVHIPISKSLTSDAIVVSTILGLLIPLIACILPIRVALGKNLHDTLDVKHSKTKAVKLELERSEDGNVNSSWIIVGSGMTIFGFLIYYLLPLSLISYNLTLFANIFFGLLLGMLFGLILLSMNFEHVTERFVTGLFLWWETEEMPNLVLKNLVAHRVRNRKTTLMYALSIGFIIFIIVSYRVELMTAEYNQLKLHGAHMAIETDFSYIPPHMVPQLEHLLDNQYSDTVRDFTWVSPGINANDYIFEKATFTNVGQYNSRIINVYAVSPNFFDVASKEFLIASQYDKETSLSLSEQLYSVSGSQSSLLGSRIKESFFLSDLTGDSDYLINLQYSTDQATNAASRGQAGGNIDNIDMLKRYRMKPLAFLDSCPRFGYITRFQTDLMDVIVSFPTYINMTNGYYKNINDIPMNALLIDFHKDATSTRKDKLSKDIKGIIGSYSINLFDMRDQFDALKKTNAVMTIVFSVATYIAMGLCLFSLIASMYTNIYEQSKEIAILRAIGMRANQITKLYVYEAYVLTLAASLLGLFIGMVMAWTMTIQRALFTQLPIGFVFPWDFALLVMLGAAVCAIISAYAPARNLMTKSVSAVMRTIL